MKIKERAAIIMIAGLLLLAILIALILGYVVFHIGVHGGI